MKEYDEWRKPYRSFKNRYKYVKKEKQVYEPKVYSYYEKQRFKKRLDDMFLHQAEGDLEGVGFLRRKYWDDFEKKKKFFRRYTRFRR